VNDYVTNHLKRLDSKFPDVVQRVDTIYFVSDKCAGQFRSRKVARAMSEWLSNWGAEFGVTTIIKVLKQTGHSGSPADGEGGHDKRAVTDFILNENTWRSKLPTWPKAEPKPIINSAKTATLVAEAIRGRTAYERKVAEKGRQAVQNSVWTINERWYYDTTEWKTDHRKSRFDAKEIPRLNDYFCWRLEAAKPRVVYLRRRPCVCKRCMDKQWAQCELLSLGEGGPGPWVEHKLTFREPRGIAARPRQRRQPARPANNQRRQPARPANNNLPDSPANRPRMRLSAGKLIAYSRGFEFAGKPYGVGKVTSRGLYRTRSEREINGTRAPVGTLVVDLKLFTRDGLVGLRYRETNTFLTIRESQIAQVRLQWAWMRGRTRRGQLDTGRELSQVSDDDLMRALDLPAGVGEADASEEEDNEDERVEAAASESEEDSDGSMDDSEVSVGHEGSGDNE
jgi:hypothetical protein